jgi:acetaldehyde dehydrogenase/alcohol dehydrogenase
MGKITAAMIKINVIEDNMHNISMLENSLISEDKNAKFNADIEKLEAKIAKVRAAQKEFAKLDQEHVDKIFSAAANAAYRESLRLAKAAVRETGMGRVEDKDIKNRFAAEEIYNCYRNTKTCDFVGMDKNGNAEFADPIGVIAAIIPTTNPTSTAIFKALLALKTRNGMIVSPHPRAKDCTIEAVKIVLDDAVAAGAPKGIFEWLDTPSLPLINALMKRTDVTLATGGPSMVEAAYSSSKPAIGVGPGNTPAIIDDSADINFAVKSIIESKTFDNGVICASEQSVIALKDIYDKVEEKFRNNKCHFLNSEEKEKVKQIIIKNGILNPEIVGQSAEKIAKLAEITVARGTKILIAKVNSTDLSEEPFAREKLSPVLAMYKAENFEDALSKAEKLIESGGLGHTSVIYSNDATRLEEFAKRMKTCRMLVNTAAAQGAIGGIYNKLLPSLTLGCGPSGGNSVSGNIEVKHLLNLKTLALPDLSAGQKSDLTQQEKNTNTDIKQKTAT